MRRAVAILGGFIVLSMGLVGSALADAGVHGGYSATTDACAGCHRTHTATGSSLLRSAAQANDKSEFCYACHGAAGQGADTNVESGLYLSGRNDPYGDGMGTPGNPLKGGGFAQAKMSTGVTNAATVAGTSSAHTVNGAPGTLWGSGAIAKTPFPGQPNFQLTCTNCHDPHGNGNYRSLRPRPVGGDAATDVNIADEQTKSYTVAGNGGVFNYFGVSYLNANLISSWCSTCHDRYLAGGSASETDSTDAIFHFRHTSNGNQANCLTCHVAHGSSAAAGANSQSVPWPGGTTGRGNDSSLLRLDNRGVCAGCHVDSTGQIAGSKTAPKSGKTTPTAGKTATPVAGNTPVAGDKKTRVPGKEGTPRAGEKATPVSGDKNRQNDGDKNREDDGDKDGQNKDDKKGQNNKDGDRQADGGKNDSPVGGNCTSCHGSPPDSGRHSKHVTDKKFSCNTCHAATVSNTNAIINNASHANGKIDVQFAAGIDMKLSRNGSKISCGGSCHSSKTW